MDLDAALTREQAALVLGVTPAMVSMWALRGWRGPDGARRRLTVLGKAGRGGRLYRLGDLLEAERDTRGNPNSHRRFSPLLAG